MSKHSQSTINAILRDLEHRNGTQGEIAIRHGCPVRTVNRFARTHGLQYGQGKRNFWAFSESTQHLAYLLGAFLTDGALIRQKDRPRGFQMSVTSEPFIDKVGTALTSIGLTSTKHNAAVNTASKGSKPQYVLRSYSSDFGLWLAKVTTNKTAIPPFLFDAPPEHKLAFIAGVIDGDGRVTVEGTISIRSCGNWMTELPSFLETASIRTTGCHVDRLLLSGKTYWRVNVNREDFRSLGGECAIPEKQERILYAVDTRRGRRRKTYNCRICGEPGVSRKNGRCPACWYASDECLQSLREMAPRANRAANSARWGFKYED